MTNQAQENELLNKIAQLFKKITVRDEAGKLHLKQNITIKDQYQLQNLLKQYEKTGDRENPEYKQALTFLSIIKQQLKNSDELAQKNEIEKQRLYTALNQLSEPYLADANVAKAREAFIALEAHLKKTAGKLTPEQYSNLDKWRKKIPPEIRDTAFSRYAVMNQPVDPEILHTGLSRWDDLKTGLQDSMEFHTEEIRRHTIKLQDPRLSLQEKEKLKSRIVSSENELNKLDKHMNDTGRKEIRQRQLMDLNEKNELSCLVIPHTTSKEALDKLLDHINAELKIRTDNPDYLIFLSSMAEAITSERECPQDQRTVDRVVPLLKSEVQFLKGSTFANASENRVIDTVHSRESPLKEHQDKLIDHIDGQIKESTEDQTTITFLKTIKRAITSDQASPQAEITISQLLPSMDNTKVQALIDLKLATLPMDSGLKSTYETVHPLLNEGSPSVAELMKNIQVIILNGGSDPVIMKNKLTDAVDHCLAQLDQELNTFTASFKLGVNYLCKQFGKDPLFKNTDQLDQQRKAIVKPTTSAGLENRSSLANLEVDLAKLYAHDLSLKTNTAHSSEHGTEKPEPIVQPKSP
jgi:hypothetical protein